VDRRLADVASAQHGVVALDQLRDIGITQRTAAHRAEQGRLHRVHRGTYAVGHRALGQVGSLRAAVLACGDGAAISHGTAAALWGLRDSWPSLIDVLVPCQAGRKVDGVRCRRCRYPSREEITDECGVPSTTPMRTLVDLAGMVGLPTLRRTLERAAVLNLLNLGELDLSLKAACRRPGTRGLRLLAEDWRSADGSVPDVRSDFEALALPRLVAMGLPRPSCNVPLHVGGELFVVDFLWEAQRLVVETDGQQTHETPVAFQRDRRRDQILVAAGYRVTRVTWRQVRDEGEAVVARIARALRSGSD
jgi:hypothetical protein